MSEEKLDGFLSKIRKTRPTMLFGYPSALSHFARHAEHRGLRMDDLGIKVAFVTSERLYDEQREQIAKTFGCRVANGYGGRDAGFIAHQCPEGSMHITAEDIIVEIVDAQGEPVPVGESGEIVVIHDSKVDRTTNGKGKINKLTLFEIKKLNAGKDQKIPAKSHEFCQGRGRQGRNNFVCGHKETKQGHFKKRGHFLRHALCKRALAGRHFY